MSAHKNFFHTSDFLLLCTLSVGAALECIFPSSLTLALPIERQLSLGLGIFLVIVAWTIIITAKYQFKRRAQKTGPAHRTTELIQDGIFAHSRNPIYVAVILLVPALGSIANSLWIILLSLPFFFIIRHVLVLPEERYLLKLFGARYAEYVARVRRWV